MKSSFRVYLLILGLFLIIILAWRMPIPSSKGSVEQAQEKLVIITPHWDGIRSEFKREFTNWYKRQTGNSIGIEWLDPGGTSDCIRYIKSEFKRTPEGIGVDLFFGGGTDPYLDLKKDGLLAPVTPDSSVLAHIPQHAAGIELYDPDGYWYGAVLSGFGIIYNKWVAKWLKFDIPQEWRDLADPRYATWIGVADPRNSGTMHLMFEIILQAYGWEQGWEILTGIAANARTFAKGASDVPRMVSRGDMAFGLAIDFYGWAEVSQAGEEKVGFLLPRNMTVVNPDAIGMLRGAPNSRAAELFIEYVLSEEGQKLWFLRKGTDGGPREYGLDRMSIRPDFYGRFSHMSSVRQNPFAETATLAFDNQLASRRWAILNDLIGIGLIDHGDALKKAWKNVTRSPESKPALWLTVATDESSFVALAENIWSDPVKKNNVLLGWHNFYDRKYRQLLTEPSCIR